MHICLIGRFFCEEAGGLGVYSRVLYERLPKYGMRVSKIQSFESFKKKSPFKFVCWYSVKLPFEIRKAAADIYHATSPFEATWLYKHKNRKSSKLATIHDAIPILYNLYNSYVKNKIIKLF